jgi:hypothetical protein
VSYRTLVAFPLVASALAALTLALVPHEAVPATLRALTEGGKVLALVGLASGALVFRPGDYLRRGWGLSAACYALLLLRDVLSLAPPASAIDSVRALLITMANACVVVGTWTLARAWGVAGLEPPGTEGGRRVAIAAAVLASLVFAGSSIVDDARITLTRDPWHAWTIASDLGDLLALPLLAPVAMTALAVKEGTLKWPWGLLAASLAAWLLYDGVLTLPSILGVVDRGAFRVVADVVRVFAAAAACAAGLAQRRAMLEFDAPRAPRT